MRTRKYGWWIVGIILVVGIVFMIIPSGEKRSGSLSDSYKLLEDTFSNVSSKSNFKSQYDNTYIVGEDGTILVKDVQNSTNSTSSVPADLDTLVNMSLDDRADMVTFGVLDSIASAKGTTVRNALIRDVHFVDMESQLNDLHRNHSRTVQVNVWQWANPNDQNNLDKVTTPIKMEVNEAIADLVIACMEEIYNDPEKPVLYFGGSWVVRSIRGGVLTSNHSLGTAFDFNTTSTAYVGSTEVTNKYGKYVHVTDDLWSQLPESQAKYCIFHDSSPVVTIFKKYGFRWGGDYNSKRDGMHFEYNY